MSFEAFTPEGVLVLGTGTGERTFPSPSMIDIAINSGLRLTLRVLQWKPVPWIAAVKSVRLSLSSSARAETNTPLATMNATPATSVPRRLILSPFNSHHVVWYSSLSANGLMEFCRSRGSQPIENENAPARRQNL